MERTHAIPTVRCAFLFFIQPKVCRALRCLSYIKLKPLVFRSNSKVLKMLLLLAASAATAHSKHPKWHLNRMHARTVAYATALMAEVDSQLPSIFLPFLEHIWKYIWCCIRVPSDARCVCVCVISYATTRKRVSERTPENCLPLCRTLHLAWKLKFEILKLLVHSDDDDDTTEPGSKKAMKERKAECSSR